MLAAGPAGPDEHLGTWTLSTLTGEIRKLADDGLVAMPSPDGRQVAFISGRNSEIWLMGAKGENARKLASAATGHVFITVSWSPDGSRVAALVLAGSDFRMSTISAYAVSDGAPTEILAEPGITAMLWKTDGHLLYAQGAAAPQRESYGLWELALDPKTGRPDNTPRQVARWLSQSVSSISASHDGRRVLITRGRTRSNVYVGQLNGPTELTDVVQLTQDDRVNWPSAWTTDGRAVFFHSDRNGDFDLFSQASSDREAQALLLGADEVRSARVSPDGRWILYLALAPTDPKAATTRVRLMRMPAGGGPPEKILETAGNWGRGDALAAVDGDYFWSYPDFRCSPSARPAPCVISEADGVDRTVFTAVDPVRGRQGEVARLDLPPGFVPWDLSPDGTRLAYATNAFFPSNRTTTVSILTLAEKTRREIPLNAWRDPAGIAWAASGRDLFITNMAVRGSTLLSLDADGRAHVLRDLAGKGLYLADPRPSPDGRQLAFGQATLGSNAWVFEAARK